MALRIGCSRMGRLARVATAALISASTLCLASAQAQAHHYSRHRHYAHATHQAHYSHYARAPHHGAFRSLRPSRIPALRLRSGRRGSQFARFFSDCRRRQQRPDALFRRRERTASSRFDHQGDDALPLVRKARQRRHDAADANPNLPARRRAGALETRPCSRRIRSASTTRSRPS